jgi:hypothetical protein
VTVNYTVTAPGGGTPTGTVTVTASGGTESCTGTVGEGGCQLTLEGLGDRTLTAAYSPGTDENFSASASSEEPHRVENVPPEATKDTYTIADGQRSFTVPAASGVLANDIDAQEGDTLTVKLLRGPNVGSLKLRADGSFVYKMSKRTFERNEFNGVAFIYEVSDGAGNTDRAKVTINKGR